MATNKSIIVAVALIAIVASVCIDWTRAQKTRQPSQSVYGGYQAAPVKQRPVQQIQQEAAPRPQFQPQPPRKQPAPRPVQAPAYQTEEQQNQASYESSSSSAQQESDSEPASYGAVAGKPGVDFPAYASIPKTSFTCSGKPYDGFYPDEEAGCQAYHVCWENRHESFLCGVGTLFNAKNQHCDYWYNVECNKSSEHYSLNRFFGTSTPENSATGPVQQPNNFRQSDSSAQQPAFAKRPQQPQQQQQQGYDRSAAASSWRGTQQEQQQQSEY